ncbi:MAG TPA: TlpA disulfide reductase family protein [Gaiellaceae bacterium]|nr:TlpA disulfide reductase family protein [Gaiellaceae bacterium]
MRRAVQAVAAAAVLALLGLLVWDVVHGGGGKVAREVDKGEIVQAPLFTRKRVDTTGSLSLVSLRGKVVVLNFWQSYCAPCTREARTLADTAERWKDRGVVFLGVDEQDLRGPALKFMRRFDIRYPIVADDLSLTGHYGVTGYPETFFIDRRGRVIPPHIVGPATRETLEQGIRRALAR